MKTNNISVALAITIIKEKKNFLLLLIILQSNVYLFLLLKIRKTELTKTVQHFKFSSNWPISTRSLIGARVTADWLRYQPMGRLNPESLSN